MRFGRVRKLGDQNGALNDVLPTFRDIAGFVMAAMPQTCGYRTSGMDHSARGCRIDPSGWLSMSRFSTSSHSERLAYRTADTAKDCACIVIRPVNDLSEDDVRYSCKGTSAH